MKKSKNPKMGIYMSPHHRLPFESPPNVDEEWAWDGPENVTINATNNGLIFFDFNKNGSAYQLNDDDSALEASHGIKNHSEFISNVVGRAKYINAFLVLLYSSGTALEKKSYDLREPASPINCVVVDSYGVKGEIAHVKEKNIDPPYVTRYLQKNTAENAVINFNKCYTALGAECIDVLSLMDMAIYLHYKHQHEAAQVLAWTINEKLLKRMWATYLDKVGNKNNGHTVINHERKKGLTSSKWDIYSIIESLSLANEIDDSLYKRLGAPRKARNSFIHTLDRVEHSDAEDCIRLAADIIQMICDVMLIPQMMAATVGRGILSRSV
jgi:hypothetical protein